MGLMYGRLVENIVASLTIHYKGWKSIYFNPERKPFIDVAQMTLEKVVQRLVSDFSFSNSGANCVYVALLRYSSLSSLLYLMFL